MKSNVSKSQYDKNVPNYDDKELQHINRQLERQRFNNIISVYCYYYY